MPTPAPILLAEDDDNDVFLLRRALAKAGLPNQLVVARDGQEAIDYLAGAHPFGDRSRYPLPGLVLLDLKMPRINGFDVLAWKAARAQFNGLPVVVLSSSSQESDIEKARQMGAADYQMKPAAFEELVNLLKTLNARWMK